jgi:hypothetical protein
MFSYVTQNTHDGEDIASKFWKSYSDLKRETPLAAQPPNEAVAVDVHCLVSLHVTASVGFWAISIVQMAESYERVVQRVETVSQRLMRG